MEGEIRPHTQDEFRRFTDSWAKNDELVEKLIKTQSQLLERSHELFEARNEIIKLKCCFKWDGEPMIKAQEVMRAIHNYFEHEMLTTGEYTMLDGHRDRLMALMRSLPYVAQRENSLDQKI